MLSIILFGIAVVCYFFVKQSGVKKEKENQNSIIVEEIGKKKDVVSSALNIDATTIRKDMEEFTRD